MSESRDQLPATAFIGAGRMASAIVRGLLAGGKARAADLACTCGNDPSGPSLAEATGVRFEKDPAVLLRDAEMVLFACKPQQLSDLPETLASGTAGKLVLSILAGIPLKRLRQVAPEARNIVRIMPNTPAQIGRGVSAFASDHPLSPSDRGAVEILLSAMGTFAEVPEDQLDAVTALSGSGPAYVFEFARLLADAGIELGLPEDTATLLARHTVSGAAALLESRSDTPAIDLVREVTSPGGTTEAALKVLEKDFPRIISEALRAARDRSKELSNS